MGTATSAAGRLHSILVEAVRLPNTLAMKDAWGTLLKVSAKDRTELLHRLADVLSLPLIARLEVNRLDHVNHAHLLQWVEPVNRAFSAVSLDASWEAFKNGLGKDTAPLLSLQIAADMIDRQWPQPACEDDELRELSARVAGLRDDVLASRLASDLKEFILEHLRRVQHGIDAYHVRGPEGLRDAVQNAYGALLTQPDIARRATKTAQGRRFADLLNGLLVAVSLSADLLTLGQFVGPALLPPSAVEGVVIEEPPSPAQPFEPRTAEGNEFKTRV